MKWDDREESQNVEDRRGIKPGTLAAGGGGIVILILALVFGVDPARLQQLFQGANPQGGGPAAERQVDPAEERMARFAKVVFNDTEVIWEELFKKTGRPYEKPILVLFSDQVESECGIAGAAVGPFYCPADNRVFLDLSF